MRVMVQATGVDPGLEELRVRLTREIRDDCALWVAQLGTALRPGLRRPEPPT